LRPKYLKAEIESLQHNLMIWENAQKNGCLIGNPNFLWESSGNSRIGCDSGDDETRDNKDWIREI